MKEVRVEADDLDIDIRGCEDLSIRDRILAFIFNEKGSTKSEIFASLGRKIPYNVISSEVIQLENKGLVVEKNFDGVDYFYLTAFGAYETEYRLNSTAFFEIYDYFVEEGYNQHNVVGFLMNRIYSFYIEGKWHSEDLVEQYITWCKSNDLEPKGINIKKLRK